LSAQATGRFATNPVLDDGDAVAVMGLGDPVLVATPVMVVAALQKMALTLWVALTEPRPMAVVGPTADAAVVRGCAGALPVLNDAVPDRTVAPCCVPCTWKK
jgi:hypothetical protein